MTAPPRKTTGERTLSPGWVFASRLLILAALLVDGYLMWVSLHGGAVAGCGPDSDCDKVLHSRWSSWFGIPVSAIAAPVYAMVFLATIRLGAKTPPLGQRQAWRILFPGAVLIAGAGLWFVWLQVFVIKSLCPYCLLAHTCGFAAALILLVGAPIHPAPEKPWQQENQVFVPPPLARKLFAAALAALALLAIGQTLYQPRTYAVNRVAASATTAAQSGTQRLFTIYDGQFQFNLDEVPLLGPPDAPHVMVSLFDYTCSLCRATHVFLNEARYTFSNQLAVVSLPMPMDSACNSAVKQTPRPHLNACEYAKLGLAVWRANRAAMMGFDEWMFAPLTPPPLSEARRFAAELVGTNELAKALQDNWVNEQLQQDVALYATNYLHLGNPNMPQLIMGTNLTGGKLNEVEDLYRLLENNLGLKAPH
jgi:uncharacterized membrane protein